MENIFVEFLPPWIETSRQPAFYDKESGTCLQQTARMYDRVNMLVRMFNKLSRETKTVVENYIEQFDDLHNYVMDYFANLDVQEEINNKLDDMAEAGTLADIISQYLNSVAIFGYDSVEDMKSAENLVEGSFAHTTGYYSKNDGGEGFYKIRTVTNEDVEDEGSIIPLNNENLVAELIINESTVNIKQFGAKGDDTTDDTDYIQKCIDFATSNSFKVFIPSGTFRVSKITISNTINMYGTGDKSVIKSTDNNTHNSIIFIENSGCEHSELHNFVIDGNRDNVVSEVDGIRLYTNYSADFFTNLHDLHITKTTGNGINLTTAGSQAFKEMRLDNILVNTCNKTGFYLDRMTDTLINRCTSAGCRVYGFYTNNGGSNKFTNDKAFWCGGGDGVTPEDANRVPSSAFTVTSDVAPVEGKNYYTRTGSDTENDYYEFVLYTGSAFEPDVTYYEMTTFYSKRYQGFYLSGTANFVTACESQDNFGDGFFVSGSENKFSNVSCDNNGLITVDGEPVSYASQSKEQLYYGIYCTGWQFYADSCCFINHLNSSIGKSQRACVYLKGGGFTTINGTQSNQVVDSIVIQKVSNPLTLSSKLNNVDWRYNLPTSYITMNTGFELTDTNKQYFYYQNGYVYYKLCVKKSDDSGILSGDTAIKLFNFGNGIRPIKFLPGLGYATNNGGYLINGVVTSFVETWGDCDVRYVDTSLDSVKQVIIEGFHKVA